MRISPLHDDFGVEVQEVDLSSVSSDEGYPVIRELFEQHSLLLFRRQSLDDDDLLRVARLFGPIEDRNDTPDGSFSVPKVSNRQAHNKLGPASDAQLMNLKANMLWHTDSTFLPVPALLNIITARVLPSQGGETQLVSTRAAWKRLPEPLKTKVADAVLWHRFAYSRAKIDPKLAEHELFTRWEDQAWRAVWRNPVTGDDALYLASHAFGVDGMRRDEGLSLIEELFELATQPENIYSHQWRVGDVLIWDERATLHRGTPWPYEQERTLASLCVSVMEADGLRGMKPLTTQGVIAE